MISPRFALLLAAPVLFATTQSPDFSGKWVASNVAFPPWTFQLKVDGALITGTATQGRSDPASGFTTSLAGPFPIYDARIDGNQITFKLKTTDGGRIVTFIGARSGDQIAFTRSVEVVSGDPGRDGILGAGGATRLTAVLNGNPGTSAPAAARPATPTGPGGVWQVQLVPNAPWTFDLTVDGESLNGTVLQSISGNSPVTLTSGKVDGTSITFKVASPDGQRTITFRGEIRGNEISFARDVTLNPGGTRGGNDIYGAAGPMQFIARRVPNTVTYRGVSVDTSAIASLPNRDAIIDALRRQIDIVDAAAMKTAQKTFLKSVPVTLISPTGGVSDNPGVYSGATKAVVLQAQVYDKDRPILLHELLHAYHDQKIADGFRNSELLALYQQARDAQQFPAGAYMLSSVQEYFAMMASVYLHGSAARDPFTRDAVLAKQPDCYRWLEKEFGAR